MKILKNKFGFLLALIMAIRCITPIAVSAAVLSDTGEDAVVSDSSLGIGKVQALDDTISWEATGTPTPVSRGGEVKSDTLNVYSTPTIDVWFSFSNSENAGKIDREVQRYDNLYLVGQVGNISGNFTLEFKMINDRDGSTFANGTISNTYKACLKEYIRFSQNENIRGRVYVWPENSTQGWFVDTTAEVKMPGWQQWTATSWQKSYNNMETVFYRNENDDVYMHYKLYYANNLSLKVKYEVYSPSGTLLDSGYDTGKTYKIFNIKSSYPYGTYTVKYTVSGDIFEMSVKKTFEVKTKIGSTTSKYQYVTKGIVDTATVSGAIDTTAVGGVNTGSGTSAAVADPTIEQENNTVTLSCNTSGATIYYVTRDANADVEEDTFSIDNATEYKTPFKITADTAVVAVAVKDSDYSNYVTAVVKYQEPETLKGDVNGDGKVNTTDAVLIARLGIGKLKNDSMYAKSDVNGDGKVNTVDAVLVARYGIGKIKTL
jgi:hypothetical protein